MPAARSDDTADRRVPSGPNEAFHGTHGLLGWLESQFERYGKIYRATINGFSTYVLSDPLYADHVLRRNWQNYTKGWAVRRVGFLLGKGLMVSEGELWQTRRRMIQPSLHRLPLFEQVIVSANGELADTWKRAAQHGAQVNVTRDTSLLALNLILGIVFGDDLPSLAADFGWLLRRTTGISNSHGNSVRFVLGYLRPLPIVEAPVMSGRICLECCCPREPGREQQCPIRNS
jgi:cytochrome P450